MIPTGIECSQSSGVDPQLPDDSKDLINSTNNTKVIDPVVDSTAVEHSTQLSQKLSSDSICKPIIEC